VNERILIIDDDASVQDVARSSLERDGYIVHTASGGDEGLALTAARSPALLVLDLGLPDIPGETVLQEIRRRSQVPIIVLSARGRMEERVRGLGLGADDYLPKPFDFAELVARVRALGRRSTPALPPILASGDLTLDPSRRVVSRAGRRLDLSPKEFAVLECLLAAGGRLVSAEELLERVWDEAADPFTTAVKTTVKRLRAKLGEPPVVHTVREGGYRVGEP